MQLLAAPTAAWLTARGMLVACVKTKQLDPGVALLASELIAEDGFLLSGSCCLRSAQTTCQAYALRRQHAKQGRALR